jgi:glycosyltransferase involved in cell wall biosynthesis
MRKKVLIDLTALKNANTGLGQVAKSFAEGFGAFDDQDLVFNFLVPPALSGAFGDRVRYTKYSEWQRALPILLPKVDLWHSTFQNYRLLRRAGNTRQILTVHDLNFLYEKSAQKAGRYLRNLQQRIDKASAVVAISQFVADDIEKNIDLKYKPLRVIYNSVLRLDDQAYQQPRFINDVENPFFFTLGQILVKKNFHVLLDVMKQFQDTNLYICGRCEGGDYGRFIANRIASENIKNVFLVGEINEQEKIWMYRHCQAFLFPSKFEGFGLPVIEAMQFGKPVFSSAMTSLPEVAGGNAFMWDSFDTAHMVECIRHNLNNFTLDQQRIARIKAHAFSFNLARHNREYLQLYREVLA